jgi:hypothetical protein
MYEHRNEPLLARGAFILRMVWHGLLAFGLVAGSLFIGMAGYHYFEGFSWLDSLVNASMLLGGMGPVNPLQTTAGKLFASFYALYSGMIFLIAAGVVFAPILHRVLHHFHLETEADDSSSQD